MIQIRSGTFETNSSSTHALAFCTEAEYNDFLQGKLLLDLYAEKLCPAEMMDDGCLSHQAMEVLEEQRHFTGCWIEYEHELVELSDGTKFGKIKFDKDE